MYVTHPQLEDTALKFHALVEDIRGDIRAIGEGYRALDARMDRFEDNMNRFENNMNRRFDRLESDVAVLKSDMRRVKKVLDLNGAPKRKRR